MPPAEVFGETRAGGSERKDDLSGQFRRKTIEFMFDLAAEVYAFIFQPAIGGRDKNRSPIQSRKEFPGGYTSPLAVRRDAPCLFA